VGLEPVRLFECARSGLEACARVTIARVKPMDAQVSESLAGERFQTFVLLSFGIAALLLAIDHWSNKDDRLKPREAA
jgi:hypothetical protein